MSTEITIPFAGKVPSAAFAALGTESLAEGIGSGYAVIGYKGKTWSLRYRGERHVFTRADDGTPSPYLDVIILRQAHAKSKSYYEGGFVEGASDGKRPVCASLDGVVPDSDVITKQSDACALCPRNEWKTDQNGRKGRDCSDYKRLAVLVLPNVTKAVLGQPLMEPAFLRVPPASLADLGIFGDIMSGQGWHYSTFITRITFDPEQSHPKFMFRPLQELSDAEAPVVLKMREDAMALRITGEDQMGNRPLPQPMLSAKNTTAVSPAPSSPASSVAPPHSQTTTTQTQAPATNTTAPSEPETVDTGFGAVTAAVKPAASTLELTAQAGGAFGLTQEAVAETQPKAAQQDATDVGEATESDRDLDERIKAMLG